MKCVNPDGLPREALIDRGTGALCIKVKRARYWIEWLLVSLSVRPISLMPLGLLRAISEFAASLVFAFDRKSRAVALANLEVAYGSELTPKQRELIAKRSFQAFGKNFLELFWTPRLTSDNLEKYVSAETRTDSAKSPSRRLLTSRLHPILGTSNWWVPSLGTGVSVA